MRERVYVVGYSTTPGGDWRGVFPIGENVRENTAKRPVGYEIGDFRNDEGWRPRKDGLAPCLATRRHSETDVSNTPPLLKDVGTFRTDAGWQSSKDGNTPTLLARARDSYCSSQTLLKVKNETFDEIGDYRSDEGWRPRKDNNCPTLAARAREDGSGQPLLKVKSATSKEAVVEPIIGAIRGRNPENPNDNSKGIEYKQRFEYNKKGTANALTSDVTANMVVEPKIYDGYNNNIKDDNIVGTITQHCSRNGMTNGFKVIEPNYTYENLNKTIEKNPQEFKEGEVKAIDCYNQNVRDEAPCLTSPEHNTTRMFDGYRIRRLTPIECERLQGFPDNHTEYGNYDGEVKKMSNTQRYKQCGNAVTVDVVQAVAEQLKDIYND